MKFRIPKSLRDTRKLALAGALILAAPLAAAVPVGTFTANAFVQSGSVLNQNTDTLIGVEIDFGVDAGGDTPIWDTSNGFTGLPPGTFTNQVPGLPNHYFTVAWMGLNITTGNAFNYSNLDLDGYINPGINGGGNTLIDGNSSITLFFANGDSFSAALPSGADPQNGLTVVIDGDVQRVPEPASLALVGLGLLALRARAGRARA